MQKCPKSKKKPVAKRKKTTTTIIVPLTEQKMENFDSSVERVMFRVDVNYISYIILCYLF